MSTNINTFIAYLAQKLTEGGSEATIYIDRITTITGETIATSDFSTFGRGIVTINPDGDTSNPPEWCSFTAVDSVNLALTGVTRGLSAKGNTVIAANKRFYPVDTPVVISFGVHNLEDLKSYIDSVVAGSVGTASDTTAGTLKITADMNTKPRAMHAIVREQNSPDMTLRVEKFSMAVLGNIVNYTGGNTPTITAPVTNPRIDLIVYSTATSAIAIRAGAEAASPSEPTPTYGDIVLASVYLRVGQTAIYDVDSGSSRSYIKCWYTPNFYGVISSSAGSADAGKTIVADSDGRVSRTFLRASFGGTGADGALAVTSGTTTIDLGGAATVIKNYTSISITGTGKVAFSNPHANGTLIILKSQGNVTITSSTVPCLDASGMGGIYGAGGADNLGDGANGTDGIAFLNQTNKGVAPITAGATFSPTYLNTINGKILRWLVGAGGAGGEGGSSAGGPRVGGNGGRGGGGLIIECAGALNFTTTGGISVAGINGSNGVAAGFQQYGSAGGGGGGGGSAIVLYNTLTANTGTINVSGGTGGTGGSGGSGVGPAPDQSRGGGGGGGYSAGTNGTSNSNWDAGNGGNGGNGISLVVLNTEFA